MLELFDAGGEGLAAFACLPILVPLNVHAVALRALPMHPWRWCRWRTDLDRLGSRDRASNRDRNVSFGSLSHNVASSFTRASLSLSS